MTGARLAAWVARHAARQAPAWPRRVLAWLPWLAPAALAAALAVTRGDAGTARTMWWLAALAAPGVCVLWAPTLLYWWPGATLLARLPLGGDALYGLALRRAPRVLAGWSVCVLALAGVLALDAPLVAARALAASAALLVGGVLLTPALGALAGVLAASDDVKARVAAAGAGAAPPLFWLSLLPAIACVVVGVGAWPAADWALGDGEPVLGLIGAGGVLGLGVIAAFAGRRLTRPLPGATREVAALDAVRLASLQLDRARGLERAVGRVVAGDRGAAIMEKDVALARRRFPMFYLVSGLALLLGWLAGVFAGEATRTSWALTLTAVSAIYLVVLGARLAREPIERPRLLAVLPLARAQIARGKLGVLVWRAVIVLLIAAPAVVRAAAPAELALRTVGVTLVALVAATVLATRRTPT